MDLLRKDAACIVRIENAITRRRSVLYTVLLIYGAVCGVMIWLAYGHLTSQQLADVDSVYMWLRSDYFEQAQQALSGGGYVPIVDHEAAYYYYLASLGNILGKTESWEMFLWIQMAAAFLVFLVYPLVFYSLTKSLTAAAASPVLVWLYLSGDLFLKKYDTYWAYAWVIAVGVPLLSMLACRAWGKKSWRLVCAICLLISVGNVPRTHAGLPAAVCLLVICLMKILRGTPLRNASLPNEAGDNADKKHLIKKQSGGFQRVFVKKAIPAAAVIALIGIAYSFFSSLFPFWYYARYGVKEESFGPWHTAYIMLGWEENKYGIESRDGYGVEFAKSVDPDVEYGDPEYMEILKREYLRIMTDDPVFFFGCHLRKLIANCKSVWEVFMSIPAKYFFAAAAGLCAVGRYCFSLRKKDYGAIGKMLPVGGACIVLGMIPGIIGYPGGSMLIGATASVNICAAAVLLAGCVVFDRMVYKLADHPSLADRC